MNGISLLIAYKPDGGRRDFLWSLVQLRYAQLMPEVEMCVGTDESELFCKARALNQAARRANGDILVMADAEVIFEPRLLEDIPRIIDRHPWVIPFSNAFRLNREGTDRFIEAGLPEVFGAKDTDIEYTRFVPGGYMNVMTRACFDQVGGLDERFKGYGFEDVAFALSLDTLCGPHHRMEGTIYHLWHPWAEFFHKNYEHSLSLYRRYEAAAGNVEEMTRLIREKQKA
jgi:hypothetical protein